MQAFVIAEPAEASPVIVEIPHAGLSLDAETLGWMIAPARSLARDADLHVDELFADAPRLGAALLAARVSRYAVDLNRAVDDYDGLAVVGGPPADRPRGVVWRLTSDGAPVLRERIPPSELERRLARYWRPYHDALAELIERRRAAFGFCVLLCAHSMPTPKARALAGPTPAPADVVPGSRGRTTSAGAFIDAVDAVAQAHGLSVEHDNPYRGGYTTGHYGRPDQGVHAVQLELARRLYLDEQQLTVDSSGFEKVKTFGNALVERLVNAARGARSGVE